MTDQASEIRFKIFQMHMKEAHYFSYGFCNVFGGYEMPDHQLKGFREDLAKVCAYENGQALAHRVKRGGELPTYIEIDGWVVK